jgi:hypothetical protein
MSSAKNVPQKLGPRADAFYFFVVVFFKIAFGIAPDKNRCFPATPPPQCVPTDKV